VKKPGGPLRSVAAADVIHADNIRKYKNKKRLYGAILHGLEIGWASGF
jgi:hypothetical protein